MTERTILLIEEDESVSRDITLILKNEGFNVIIASDYNSSLAIIERIAVDLVITDEVQPHADGFGIVEYIKHYSSIPVIQLTDGKKIEFPFSVKPDALVSKPVDPDKLILLISSCFTHRHIRQVG